MRIEVPMRKSSSAPAIAEAFAALVAEGKPVTVRALRQRAGVGTDAARQWLAANRPNTDVAPPDSDVLAALIAPLWSAAVSAARDELKEEMSRQVDAAGESEAAALTEVERLADELTAVTADCEAKAADVHRAEDAVAHLESELRDARARLDQVEAAAREAATAAARDLAAAHERAHAAEVAEAEARATARAFREVIEAAGTKER